MNKYELMFIVSSTAQEADRDATIEKVKASIEAGKGVVEGVDKIGMKKLAYEINFKNEGFYVVINFSSEPSLITELNRQLSINEFIIRHMFVKKD